MTIFDNYKCFSEIMNAPFRTVENLSSSTKVLNFGLNVLSLLLLINSTKHFNMLQLMIIICVFIFIAVSIKNAKKKSDVED